ncbi:TIGR02588 family protein [Phormidium tenue FACHB-886]|nr:TIGR02588 family protein [Phormidium tenue FACHB-886]
MKRSPSYNSSSTKPQAKTGSRRGISAEQVTFAIAALIVVSLVGLVIFSWVTQSKQPPILSIRSEAVREAQGQFYIPYSVTNDGGETAESVQVLGELEINGKVAEAGEQQIDFLSGGETEEGAFIFRQDPRKGNLTLRVASYSLP